MRYACIGHRVYFENHFLEGAGERPHVGAFDYDHASLRPFSQLLAFAAEVTLVFRPELYSASMVRMIPGIRIGFSSEPLPTSQLAPGRSGETDLREQVYRNLTTGSFDFFYHYDRLSKAWFDQRHIAVDGFRHLPIDTDVFNPTEHLAKEIDFLFLGKPTAHRIRVLERFRVLPFRFVWIAHGVQGRELASLFRRTRCVLNVHADGRPQFEPRVTLAAACGCAVLSEPLGREDYPLSEVVVERDVATVPNEELAFILSRSGVAREIVADQWPAIRPALSTLEFVDGCVSDYLERG